MPNYPRKLNMATQERLWAKAARFIRHPALKLLASALALLGGGTALTVHINANNRTVVNMAPGLASPPPPQGIVVTPPRVVESDGASASFRLVALTDEFRWQYESRSKIEAPDQSAADLGEVTRKLGEYVSKDGQAIVVLGVASHEGTDRAEFDRAADRIDSAIIHLRPIARRENVELLSANLGRFVGDATSVSSVRQRRLVVLEARGAPSNDALAPLTRKYLKTVTKGERRVLDPEDYTECRDGCGNLDVHHR